MHLCLIVITDPLHPINVGLFVASWHPDFRSPAPNAAPRKDEDISEINICMILVEIVRVHHGVAEGLTWYMHKFDHYA